MIVSVWAFYVTPNVATHVAHWGGTGFALSHLGLHTETAIYIGFIAVVVNLVVVFGGTALLKAFKVKEGPDHTTEADYFTDVADTRAPEPAVPAGT
jgi:SSS family solute:Na+ symporter